MSRCACLCMYVCSLQCFVVLLFILAMSYLDPLEPKVQHFKSCHTWTLHAVNIQTSRGRAWRAGWLLRFFAAVVYVGNLPSEVPLVHLLLTMEIGSSPWCLESIANLWKSIIYLGIRTVVVFIVCHVACCIMFGNTRPVSLSMSCCTLQIFSKPQRILFTSGRLVLLPFIG